MKKIIAVFFLLICGLVVFLATVDLKPYLAPEDPATPEQVALPPLSETDEPSVSNDPLEQDEMQPPETSTVEQTFVQTEEDQQGNDQEGDLLADSEPALTADKIASEQEQSAAPADKITSGQEQTTALAITDVDDVAEDDEPEQTLSPPIDLEITILPVGEYPFSILLDTFAKLSTAERAITIYQERGITAHWVKVDLGEKRIRYRVFTGIFSTVPEAQQYLDRKQLVDKLIKPTYYAARVGAYQDKTQLTSAFVKTSDTGFIPYILGTQKGDYHLYVGAFYTYIGATSQCRDLTDAGLSCEPVKRSTIPPQ